MIIQETSNHNFSISQRILAVVDVLLVFLVTFILIWLTDLLPIGDTERKFLAYIIMITFPLLILIITRRDLKAYGLSFHRLKDQLDMTLAIFPVYALQGAITGWLLPMFIPHATNLWQGALVHIIVWMPTFFWTASILRKKPNMALVMPAFLCFLPLVQGNALFTERLVPFFCYLLFVGPGEEFLFRGYIQSRLNEAFGRPFSFWGVSFGWGVFITALIFGLMHVLNPFNPFLGKYELYIWWGVWTVFGGLTMGYVREKAGSILPPAVLHGLPQAIASLFFGSFTGL